MECFRMCKNCDFPGVYAILNINNNKIYIGSSRNIKGRLTNHKTLLLHRKSKIKEMQEDYNKGNKFIAYVITPVRIREEQYCKDDKKDKTGTEILRELSKIKWSQNEFDIFRNQKHYGYMQTKSEWNKERKNFIKRVMEA